MNHLTVFAGVIALVCALSCAWAETGSYVLQIEVEGAAGDRAEIERLVKGAVEKTLEQKNLKVSSITLKETSICPDRRGHTSEQTRLTPGKLFDPLMADPRWPRFSASYHRYKNKAATIGAPNFGAWFTTPACDPRLGGRWQWGVQTGVFSIFDLEADSNDLVNADYFVALPTLAYERGDLSILARLFHQSSHLGDEFIIYNDVTEKQRVNLSYEGLDLTLSHYFDWLGEDSLRLYGGAGYLFHTDPAALNPWSLQYGLEYKYPTPWPHGENNYLWGFKFRPIAAADFHNREENDWSPDVSLRAGLQIDGFWSKPLKNKAQVLLEYYEGYSPNGQFYVEEIEYFGFGFHVYFD